MEFGNESDRYCNARDRSFRRRGPRYAGLFPDQFDGLLEAATGKEWQTLEVSPDYLKTTYKERLQAHIEHMNKVAGRLGADHLLLASDEPRDRALRGYLMFRKKA